MRFALISIGVNIAAGVSLYSLFGFWGIAAATSLASWINVFMLAGTLARRGAYAPGRKAWSRIGRSFTASLILGLALAAASHWRLHIQALFGHVHMLRIGPKELSLALTVVAGAALYPPLLLALGGVSRAEIRAALRRQPRAAGEAGAETPPELL
jgi:putative peptidoglycan lipid II flippase